MKLSSAFVLAAAAAFAACAHARRSPAPMPVKPVAPAPAAAKAAAPAPEPAMMPAGPLTRVGGIVVSEDAVASSLTIKDYHGRTRTFRVAGGARVTKGGGDAPVGLDKIAAGDHVRLRVGGDTAASVHVMVRAAR